MLKNGNQKIVIAYLKRVIDQEFMKHLKDLATEKSRHEKNH